MPSQISDALSTSYDPCLFIVEFSAKFAKMLKQCDEYYCFMLNFKHCVVHNSDKVAKVN